MKTLIAIAVLGIISMLSEILGYKKILLPLVLVGLLAALGLTLSDWNDPQLHYDMMYFDNYAVAFSSLIIILLIIWVILSRDQYQNEFNTSDHYALILFTVVGGIVLVSFQNLVMLFIGIEILSIPLYILAGSRKKDLSSNEASLKYFMMGAFTTGILLFGITLIYGATGSFDLTTISNYVVTTEGDIPALFFTGLLFLMIALGFKVSAVPFHFWAPDVYQGSPTMITAYMASIVKTIAFGAFYRLFSVCFSEITGNYAFILSVIIILTIVTGNILASGQSNVKRMLAYSGISQAGYMLMTLLIVNNESTNSLLFYAGSYSLATMAAFAVLYLVSLNKGSEDFEAFNGLGKNHPVLAIVMTVSMFSLAGIPPAVGFFAKFFLFATVLSQGYTAIVIVAILGSLISVYYYFKVIIAMYGKKSEIAPAPINFSYQITLVIMTFLIVLLGISPNFFIEVIR